MGFFAFLTGDDIPDYASFLALVKETGRHLNTFVPPEGFSPEGPSPEIALSAESAKALGAGSLRDFYSLALEGEEAKTVKDREGRLPAFFPKGPESVRPALNFIEAKCVSLSKAVSELKKNWPPDENGLEAAVRPLENTLVALEENKAGLTRVERDLWPRMKQEALEWPRDAKSLWHKAQSLKQNVSPLLKASKSEAAESDAPGLPDRNRRSLTRATMELKNQVGRAKEIIEAEAAWARAYDNLLTDLDDYMAVVVDGNQSGRDWNSDSRWLSNCLSSLEKEDRRLRDETAQSTEAVKASMRNLVETETRLSGHQGSEMLEGLETVGRGVQALWRSTIERRRQMARLYFTIPSRLGRPLFLEKSMMATAQALGRTQSLLEDLRHQLSLAGGKLSTTHRLRSDGKSLLESLAQPKSRSSKIKIARKRLNVLAAVVDQRLSLVAAKGELESVVAKGEEVEKQLSRGRVENSRMYRELKAAALERERLTDQLTSARQKLGEAGLVKARLLKVFAHKSAIWDEIERSRRKLLADNEALKAEKAELKLKRSRLAGLYSRERRELKKLTAELKNSQGELIRTQEYIDLRHDLETRLDETRREKDAVMARSREVETQLQERSAQLASAVAQADSLSLELARHREELVAASKARLSLGEKAAALRRRQDILAQAHVSLQKALRRKSGQLVRTEAEREALAAKLDRQKKNLLRLVATRQQLRAELGAARLQIFDLEKERDEIFSQLKDAQSAIEVSDRERNYLDVLTRDLAAEKDVLTDQILVVSREKDGLLVRLEELETEKRLTGDQVEFLSREKGELVARLAALNEDKELSDQEAGRERAELQGRLAEVEKELVRERELNTGRLEEAAREKDQFLLRLATLEAELKDKESLESDRIKFLHREKEGLIDRLKELEGENVRLASVEDESNDIKIRLSALEEEKSRLTSFVSDLETRNEELGGQLAALEGKVSEELFPFIKIMGEALWRSESQLKRARNASTRLLERFQLEFEVREANLRLQAAGRELELASNATKETKGLEQRLEVLETEHQSILEERNQLAGRNVKLRRAVGALRERYSSRLAESRESRNSLSDLLATQSEELEAQKALLADKNEELENQRIILVSQAEEIETQKAILTDKNEELESQRTILASQAEELETQKTILADNNEELENQRTILASQAEELEAQKTILAGRDKELESHKSLVADRNEEIETQKKLLADQDEKLTGQMELLAGLEEELRSQRSVLSNREQELSSHKSLLASQEQELSLQKDKLAKLEPLVSYFIASAEINSGSPAGFNHLDPELLAYLKEAGKVLGQEIALDGRLDEGEPAQLLFDVADPADLPLIARLRARLNEVQPLVSFLASSFVAGIAELAQARQERSDLNEELTRVKTEREQFFAEAHQLREEDAELKAELEILRQENSTLSGRVNLAGSTRSTLESSLDSRETEISQLRDQASVLAQERDQLQGSLEEKKKEIGLLKNELAQADRDLAENDGRLEAAWAAMNYLGTRASDTLGNLKSKLETQARQVDHLSLELKRREMMINSLEERQNKLALLYWALVARAATAEPGQLAAQAPVPDFSLEGNRNFLEAANDFDVAGFDLEGPVSSADNANNSGGHNLDRGGLIEGVKKVARRSLFTLILAGGLVMSGPLGADAAYNTLKPQSGIIVASVSEADPQLRSRLDSTYIGRTVSLEKVDADLRLAGRPAVENRLAEMIAELATEHGLTNGEFLRLMRVARGPEDTVHLDEFKGRQGGLALLGFHLPKLSRQMLLWPPEILTRDKFSVLLKSASDFKPSEGGFWERMYFDLIASGRGIDEALTFILETLGQKKILADSIRPEYAGRLAPFPQLENLGPDRFITFMADYINDSWPNLTRRGRHQAARRLAGDIYFAARLFKLPTTLLASVIHEESEVDQLDFFRRGSTYAVHVRAADLADLTRNFTLVWQEGHPPLCDLDEALASSEKEVFVEGVYRRKMSLVMAYNKTMNSGGSLFDEI